jgi:hypothetical protein
MAEAGAWVERKREHSSTNLDHEPATDLIVTTSLHSERMSRTALARITVLCLLTAASTARAQDTRRDLTAEISALASDLGKQFDAGVQASVASTGNRARLLTIAGILARIPRVPLADVERARLDEQLGAAPDSRGTTNLVSRSGSPSMVAVAIERGAFWPSAGTTGTLRLTPGGVAAAIAGRRFGEMLPGARASGAGRVSLSATLDVSGRDTSAGPAAGGAKSRLAQWTSRVQILNRRRLADPYLRWLWTTQPGLSPADIEAANESAWQALSTDPAFLRWLRATDDAIHGGRHDRVGIEARLLEAFRRFPVEGAAAPPDERLASASTDALRFASAASSTLVATPAAALHAAMTGSALTMEYVSNRPVLGSSFSTIRLIAAGGRSERTGNVALTFFDDVPAGGRRFRNIDLAGQVEVGTPTLASAIAMRFEYFPDDPASAPGSAVGSATLWAFQLMYTVRPPGGVRIPVSISFANRTEQLKEKDFRASIGLSFDVDGILARLRP